MNPIVFALRHPVTILVGAIAIALGCGFAIYDRRIKIDIFPSLNLPVVYVAQPYGGMDPAQMEGLLTNYYEYHFLYIGGIHHVESKNIQGIALMKLYFHPGTNMAQAIAETIAQVNRSRAFMPPGTVPPFVMRFDTGSVPVGYLVLKSATKTVNEIQDQALFKVRPMFASLPGVSAPPPFGGNQRTIVVRVDPDKLRSYRVSPDEVLSCLSSGNLVSPSGNIRIGDQMPVVPSNSLVGEPKELGNIPIKPGSNVHLKDLATIEDGADIPTGYALVNGRRAVYIVVTKRADASTLSVVQSVRDNIPKMQQALPEDIEVSFEFDQSPYVRGAIWGVLGEAGLGALFTGLAVLLFLRDWRSVIVVVVNIPLSLLAAVVALWLTDQTINLMTLGGLALAVGILVDESTVEIENIHAQMARTDSMARAVRLGNQETAVPRLLAMLCIVAVFLSSFFMEGAIRALFVPLALAVGFAMIASYILSSTLVPVLSVWLLRRSTAHAHAHPSFLKRSFLGLVRLLTNWRWIVVPSYLAGALFLIWFFGRQLGSEIFPSVDAGQFQLRLRGPVGTRVETTEELAVAALDAIKQEVGPENVAISLGYVGVIPPSYPINTIYLWTCGPEEAVLRVSLRRGSGIRVEALKEKLRAILPNALAAYWRPRLQEKGMIAVDIDKRLEGIRLSFEPADIINEVMSFGAPTQVDVAVTGNKLADSREYANRIREQLIKIDSLRDLQYAQSQDYPTVEVRIDRQRAGQSGVTAEDISKSLVSATSSSRFVLPNYWRDPGSGIGYQVQVEIPQAKMDSMAQIGMVPVTRKGDSPLLLRDVAEIKSGVMPGEFDRYNMKRQISQTANVHGEDLGNLAIQVEAAVKAAGAPPAAVSAEIRGQLETMRQLFGGLRIGLVFAVVTIFLLLLAYFQSFRLAFGVVLTIPAVLAGVILMLWFTKTTVNIQSFMGAIMAVGVAVANAILLITFAERARLQGASVVAAAVDGASHRVRPILMTSCAMMAGMVPLALAMGEGGEQTAPLGRAVLGGLLFGTLSTLFLQPALFATVQTGNHRHSPSLDPDDPNSVYYDPQFETQEQEATTPASRGTLERDPVLHTPI